MRRLFYLCLALTCFIPAARAEVKLPSVLADHMVVQRDVPVHLWGTALPGEKIHAEFRGNAGDTVADKLGVWSLYLPGGAFGGPFAMTIQGDNKIVFKDVLVGDVWLASGQSNMEMPMGLDPPWHDGVDNYQTEIAAANYPMLRLFKVEMTHNDFPQHDAVAVTWQATTPASVNSFSAIGYYFGREILQNEHIPIGVIEANVGASPAEAWTSMDALTADAANMEVFANWARTMDNESTRQLKMADAKRKLKADPTNDMLIKQSEEVRPQTFYAPSQLFNGMINFMTPFPIKGVIWFQGEGNAQTPERAIAYRGLMNDLITDWRTRWNVGDFPFYFVQLSNHEGKTFNFAARESQLLNLSIANTGMAVTIDVGQADVYHPRNKIPVAHRLALIARAQTYGEKLEFSGPLFVSAVPEGNKMVVTFTHANGMMAKGGVLKGFEVAGENGNFMPADAVIDGNKVIASSAKVPQPVYVRYAYAPNPDCPLFNSDGLPASPFTSKF